MKTKENEKINKYLDLIKEPKTIECEGDVDINSSWSTWNCPQMHGKETGGIENQKKNRNHPDYSIKIGYISSKIPGNLTQIPEKDKWLKLVWKALQERNNKLKQQTSTKGLQALTLLAGKGGLLGIVTYTL